MWDISFFSPYNALPRELVEDIGFLLSESLFVLRVAHKEHVIHLLISCNVF